MVTVSTVDSKWLFSITFEVLINIIVEIIKQNLIKCKTGKYSKCKEAVQLSYSSDYVNAMVKKNISTQ